MPVYFAGYSGDIIKIYNFAFKNKLKVIEDAAHAFGSIYKGKTEGYSGQGKSKR